MDLNHAVVRTEAGGRAAPDGNTLVYAAADAPGNAQSGQAFNNQIRAQRDPVNGWSGFSLSPPLLSPVEKFQSFISGPVAADLLSTFEQGTQPLTGGTPIGTNAFVRRSDGTYRLLTPAGQPRGGAFVGGNDDFSRVYFSPARAQLSSDPIAAGNTYSWTESTGLNLVGILPDGTPAPNGASLIGSIIGPISTDGSRAAFLLDDGTLYLRIDDARTVEVGGPVSVDPGNPDTSDTAGVTAAGTKVLFTSRSELTGDANTGLGQSGRDLYSYDVATGSLTDLTVVTDPADAATGANVQNVLGASPDGAYIYFTATGSLAPGGTSGRRSLYVWHDGTVSFIADGEGLATVFPERVPRLYVTPSGRHAVFSSRDSLTGYDNRDLVTGQPHIQVFEATYGQGVECVSCRADGTRPSGDSNLRTSTLLGGRVRVASDDGRRVFFESSDAVVPQAPGGNQQVFEYANGQARAISRVGSSAPAFFLEASASGDDVFFATYDDLVPNPDSGASAVFDARVGGGFPLVTEEGCSGLACHALATPVPALLAAASITFAGPDPVPGGAENARGSKVTVAKIRTVRGSSGSLKVKVPGKGRLTVTGSGLQTKRTRVSKAQTLTMQIALTRKAARRLDERRALRVAVKVAFSNDEARMSAVTLSVMFKSKAPPARKGRES